MAVLFCRPLLENLNYWREAKWCKGEKVGTKRGVWLEDATFA
jgi:hypothetical protein